MYVEVPTPIPTCWRRVKENSMHTMGFFDAGARDAGEIIPDEGKVCAADASALPLAANRLHPELQFGRFDLWPSLVRALEALARELRAREASGSEEPVAMMELCESGALLFLRHVLLAEVHCACQ